jgi:hypothetical protein
MKICVVGLALALCCLAQIEDSPSARLRFVEQANKQPDIKAFGIFRAGNDQDVRNLILDLDPKRFGLTAGYANDPAGRGQIERSIITSQFQRPLCTVGFRTLHINWGSAFGWDIRLDCNKDEKPAGSQAASPVIPSAAPASGSPKQTEILTNSDVTAMVKAGLPSDVIVAKVTSTACRFQLDANGLITLKQASVPDQIIRAMFAKNCSESAANSSDGPSPSHNALAEAAPQAPVSRQTGRVKGVLTYYFNTNYGNKPDVGALVALIQGYVQIPQDEFVIMLQFFNQLNIGSQEYKNVKYTVADGNGNFEIDDIDAGEYTLVIQSRHVHGSSGGRVLKKDAGDRVESRSIKVQPGQTVDASYDFGISAF